MLNFPLPILFLDCRNSHIQFDTSKKRKSDECSDAKISSEKCSTIISAESNDNSEVDKSNMVDDGATVMNPTRIPKLGSGALNKSLFRTFNPTSGPNDVSQIDRRGTSGTPASTQDIVVATSSQIEGPSLSLEPAIDIEGKSKVCHHEISFDLKC